MGVIEKLFSVIFALLSPFKRLLCWLGRRRKNSGTILPLVNHYPGPPDIAQSVPSNETDLEPWENWGADGQSAAANHTGYGNYSNHALSANQRHVNRNVEPEEEPDVDYFQDMTPAVKKTKKILIRKKEDHSTGYPNSMSNRLAMTSEVPATGPDLGAWDESENNAWGDEVREDLTWEAQAAIRETRRVEREQRQLEQQKKKFEREALRSNKKDSHLSAVRLS